jgi:hypothetical protein
MNEAQLEEAREQLAAAVADARLNSVQTKVAWLLNHLPDTRNSDITLQLRYWEQFCSEIYRGGEIRPEDLYRLPRLTSLSRARATVQNTLGLYLADEEVRRRRGTLQEEAQEEQVRAGNVRGSFSVFVDESGKTGDYLIVGSCWLLDGIASLAITRNFESWRQRTGFKDELHFAQIGRGNLRRYMEAVDLLAEHSAALSFKSIAVERRGAGNADDVLEDLMYHLLIRGVTHERDSGRATLPRTLQVWKDSENPPRDRLVIANLTERLNNARLAEFDGQLIVGNIFAHDSKSNPFLQFADLFVASTNRRLQNPDRGADHPKDRFADRLLATFGAGRDDIRGDMVVFEDI